MPGALPKLLYHSSLPLDGGGKYNERLLGLDKDRGITQQLPSQAKQIQLEEIN